MGSSQDGKEPENPAPAHGLGDTAPDYRPETRCDVRSENVSLLCSIFKARSIRLQKQ